MSVAADELEEAPPPRRGFALVAAVALLGIGGFAATRVVAPADDATAQATAASSAATSQASSRAVGSATTKQVEGRVAVSPATAKVRVDGAVVELQQGAVMLRGRLGSVHQVRLENDGQSHAVDVVLTERGPHPAKVAMPAADDGDSARRAETKKKDGARRSPLRVDTTTKPPPSSAKAPPPPPPAAPPPPPPRRRPPPSGVGVTEAFD